MTSFLEIKWLLSTEKQKAQAGRCSVDSGSDLLKRNVGEISNAPGRNWFGNNNKRKSEDTSAINLYAFNKKIHRRRHRHFHVSCLVTTCEIFRLIYQSIDLYLNFIKVELLSSFRRKLPDTFQTWGYRLSIHWVTSITTQR